MWLQIVFRRSIKTNKGASFESPRIVRAKSTNHLSKEQRLSSPTLPTKMLWEDDEKPAVQLSVYHGVELL